MGYYTYFAITMIGSEEAEMQAENDAQKSDNWCLKELVVTGGVEAKWYSFFEDFSTFAKQHPDILFIVDGHGEDSDDIWQHRFRGDIDERHDIEMPPFQTLLTEKEIENNKSKQTLIIL